MQRVSRIRRELPVLGGRKLYHLLLEEFSGQKFIGRDALFDLLRENGLLIRRRKRKAPLTTISWHHFHKWPNLYKGRIPDGANKVWVADITYIRTAEGDFLYLSLLTDAYSHKIVGWHLSDRLNMQGPLLALNQALAGLPAGHSLIHHSDRGVQYCSGDYTKLLIDNKVAISMTQSGDPRENAVAERVNGILKSEWIDRQSITCLEQGRERISSVVDLYNNKRPHMSIDMLTPSEAHQMKGVLKRRWKTYYKKNEQIIEEINKENDSG